MPGHRVERDDKLKTATLVLARPPLNVLGAELLTAVARDVRALAAHPDHRLLVIRADGKAFSAGADVQEHLGRANVERMLRALHELVRALEDHPRPSIALVRGACLGGGLELAVACDLVWAASDATLGTPEVKLGVFAPAAAALLPRRIGLGRTLELLLSGTALSAQDALAHGIVDRVLPGDDFDRAARAGLEALARHPGPALGLARRAARLGLEAPSLSSALDAVERLYLDEALPLHDATEGLNAFLEKRAPVWRDA